MTRECLLIGVRALPGFAVVAFATLAAWPPAAAQKADKTSPRTAIGELGDALLAAMKAGAGARFKARYRPREPVIVCVFNLDAILAASIGLSWTTLPSARKAGLSRAFRHDIVSSHVANFNSDTGQSFPLVRATRTISSDGVVVQTRQLRANGSSIGLDTVMRRDRPGGQAVDVLTDGSIRRVVVQRSDVRQLLASALVQALATALKGKVAALSGGMMRSAFSTGFRRRPSAVALRVA